jgi:FixJ family two-component response regulator
MKKLLESDRAPLVAIVDDDDSLRRSTRMLVTSFGFRSEAFARAKDFLTWGRLDEVSCLILDVLMPDMNGIELQRQLSRTRPRLPIIFITARAKEHEERQAMSAGAVAVLRKPVADDVLLNTIRRALDRGTFQGLVRFSNSETNIE